MEISEYRRKFRVCDQMLSSHAALRDRYRRLATGLILIIMALSIAGVALALQDDPSVGILGIDLEAKEWLAILAAVVLFCSIVDLVIDWRGRAWGHAHAAERLGELKGQFRGVEIDGGKVETGGVNLDVAYEEVMAAIIEIPNAAFNRLKAKHRRKVAVSKLLDESPGAPLLYLRWRVLRESLAKARATKEGAGLLEESPPSEEGN